MYTKTTMAVIFFSFLFWSHAAATTLISLQIPALLELQIPTIIKHIFSQEVMIVLTSSNT